jgi:hypothetical protein
MLLLSSGCLITLCCCCHETCFDCEDIFSCGVFLFQCQCVCAAVSTKHNIIVIAKCVCAAVSTEHNIIVIAKCWIILYSSKNQLQTVCYENFVMLCLIAPHSETIRYYTMWCYTVLLGISQHYVEAYCLIPYLHHSTVFQQLQTQEGNIRNKT